MADPDLSQFIAAPKSAGTGSPPDLSQFMAKEPTQPSAAPDLSAFLAKPKPAAPYKGPYADQTVKAAPQDGLRQFGADVVGRTKMRASEAMKSLAERKKKEGIIPNPLQTAADIGDITSVALSPLGGVGDAIGTRVAPGYGKPGSKGGEERKFGDLAEFITPIPGEKVAEGARAVKGVVKGAGEALRGAKVAKEAAPVAEAAARTAPHEWPGTPVKEGPQRAVAAKVENEGPELSATGRPADPHAPQGSHAASEPIVGSEADPVERVDNALYRLGGHATADKIELQQAIKALPKEVKDPKIQEELYYAIEQKMVDPNAEIPEHLKPAMAAMRPYYEEQTSIINRLRERNDPEIEPYLEDQGYVARRVKGQTPIFDTGPGARPKDPILGKRSLVSKAQAQKERTAGFVATDADGKSNFWPSKPPETDLKGRPYANVRQATTAEIEANRPDVRYHKNALANTIDNVARLRRVERNLQVLDEVKTNLKAEGLAHQDYHFYRNEAGQLVKQPANSRAPEGFQALPHIPQLEGYSFDPKIAEAFKDYYPSPDEPLDDILQKINRTMTATMFITPFPHIANVGSMWTVGRGWDWMNPGAYPRMMKTGAKAMSEVLSLGPKYRQMLREGSALQSGDEATRNFYQSMLQVAGREIEETPGAKSQIAKLFGLPVDAYKAISDASHKALWNVSDMMLLQRQMELEERGLSHREAIKEAEKWIANYRIPPQVMGSRAFQQFLKSGRFIYFGRYTYGKFRALGEMAKAVAKGTMKQKIDAAGKILALGVMSLFVYPLMDKMWQGATGNKDARVHRGGSVAPVDAAMQFSKGEKDWAATVSSFLSTAPAIDYFLELRNNRYGYSGKPVVEPGSTPLGKAVQLGEYAAQPVYPAELAVGALKPGGAAQSAGRLVGVDLPPEGKEQRQAKGKKYERSQARSREKKDPTEKFLKGLLGQ